MNRKQRRAALSQQPQGALGAAVSSPADKLFAEGAWHQELGQVDQAVKSYKRALSLDPLHPPALNNLACLLLQQGHLDEASERFAKLLTATPELADQPEALIASLCAVNPAFAQALERFGATDSASSAFPEVDAIANDPLLQRILTATTIRDLRFERLLTASRGDILRRATTQERLSEQSLVFYAALAQQCFINEYVFDQSEHEKASVDQLQRQIEAALVSGAAITPLQLIALASYTPLHAIAKAELLQKRGFPRAVAELITQQVTEPSQERKLRDAIACLTPVEDAVSQKVRAQYEENPYPRWIHTAAAPKPTTVTDRLRAQFPEVPLAPVESEDGIDILIAGCGTGRQSIETAQTYKNARVLAIDLSLASLAYAKRKTPAALAERIEYAQADILNLGSIRRTFDVVDSSGVLHHMADPFAAWRSLLASLRPHGVMRIGLYSETARKDVAAARDFIARGGFDTSPDGIRAARRALLGSELRSVARMGDFFSSSECRDLLFHVQETRVTLPQIKGFLDAENLKLIGFDFEPTARERYRAIFAASGWSMSDLDRWHDLELREPQTFASMYQFWVKRG